MTAPLMSGGASLTPALVSLDRLGAAPGGAATSTAVDPMTTPFAGLLARLVMPQPAATENGDNDAAAMVEAALASLEAAMAESASANGAGSSAIRALVELVARNAGEAARTGTTETTETTETTATRVAGVTPAPMGVAPAAEPTDEESRHIAASAEASAAALATPAVATPVVAAPVVDLSAVVRETAVLDPALRARLDRVVERMQAEFGHTVTVTETVRSQVRQDALYEQGRSQPGQVVTWTRASRHADGLAVDVMIDGRYDSPVAFARLQRVANEEGLHTLGARDPGHLELRSPQVGGFTARMETAAFDNPMLRPAAPPKTPVAEQAGRDVLSRIARVARVAEVAVTAGVAGVARVAQVAAPGASAPRMVEGAAAATAAAATAAAAGTAAPGTAAPRAVESATVLPTDKRTATRVELPSTAVTGAPSAAKTSTRERASDAGTRERRPGESHLAAPAGATTTEPVALPFTAAAGGTMGAGVVSPIAAPDQASRVARIDTLNAQAAAQPVSSMVLNLDNGDGGTDRIRVDVRGTSVASTIDVRDQQSAADLQARSSELTRALESRGLEADSVRVRTVVPERLATDAARPALHGGSGSARSIGGALATDASNPSRREQDDPRNPREGSSQAEQDSHRQRSRREREEYQQ